MTSPNVALRVFGRSDIGRVRQKNEDAFVIADLMQSLPIHTMPEPIAITVDSRGVLLAVSDGMGGAQAGDVASALTLHSLRLEMPAGEGGSAEAALTASVEKANEKVWNAATDNGRQGMGATLTAVLIHGRRAYVAEVGDSRAYVLRGSRFVQLTRDQSYVQHLVDRGSITRQQASQCEFKNIILQAMGVQPDVFVALNRLPLRRFDRLLLCSDGLSGKVSDLEMQAILIASATLELASEQLIEMALQRGGDDNITVMTVHVQTV